MQVFSFGSSDKVMGSGDPMFDHALALAHSKGERPKCMCKMPGQPMYIAKIGGVLYIKRMPNTGESHDCGCESYEPPAELSGLGQVLGAAIQESTEDGLTTLKLDFSLSKTGKKMPAPSDNESDSVSTSSAKLSLRGTLHYLWEKAGFNQWTPAMEGKRNWWVIRKYLLLAAQTITVKNEPLSGLLYMPESFSLEQKTEIAGRRAQFLARAVHKGSGPRQLMIVVAELKEVADARYGRKIVFKHAADFPFMLDEALDKKLAKRFANELGLWNAIENMHLVAIGVFSVGGSGVASIEELSLVLMDENWLPIEDTIELGLIGQLVCNKRRFTKSLRYNLQRSTPLAVAVVTGLAGEPPTAMYIEHGHTDDRYSTQLAELMAQSKVNSWVWRVAEGAMPPLPTLKH